MWKLRAIPCSQDFSRSQIPGITGIVHSRIPGFSGRESRESGMMNYIIKQFRQSITLLNLRPLISTLDFLAPALALWTNLKSLKFLICHPIPEKIKVEVNKTQFYSREKSNSFHTIFSGSRKSGDLELRLRSKSASFQADKDVHDIFVRRHLWRNNSWFYERIFLSNPPNR